MTKVSYAPYTMLPYTSAERRLLDFYRAEKRTHTLLTVSASGTGYRGEWNTFSPRPVKLASCRRPS